MAQLKLLFFASLQDVVGQPELTLDVASDWTVAHLLDELALLHPDLKPLRGAYRVAVDCEFAQEEQSLRGAKEVALIPPVSGGQGPWVRLDSQEISSDELLKAVRRPDCGAVVLFLGTVRDSFQDLPVDYIDYSAYQAMALRQLQALAQEAQASLSPGAVALWHRLGKVPAGEASVGIAVASKHRKQAFEVAENLIDRLKAEVSLWKREVGPTGAVWIEGDCRVPSSET